MAPAIPSQGREVFVKRSFLSDSTILSSLLAGFLLASLPGISAAAADPRDPWEGYNRAMHSINDGLDKAVIKPVATLYKTVTPEPVDQGVTNFFSNLGEIKNFLNTMLQGKLDESFNSLARFTVNSTIGVLGFMDVATNLGIEKSSEDFGQTLGAWGSGPGPYFVLPLFGPSTVRDAIGKPFDIAANPATWTNDAAPILFGVDLLDYRADLIDTEESVEGITEDEYILIRNAYLDQRAYAVSDGEMDADAYDIEE